MYIHAFEDERDEDGHLVKRELNGVETRVLKTVRRMIHSHPRLLRALLRAGANLNKPIYSAFIRQVESTQYISVELAQTKFRQVVEMYFTPSNEWLGAYVPGTPTWSYVKGDFRSNTVCLDCGWSSGQEPSFAHCKNWDCTSNNIRVDVVR